jgi:hypothetical protein
MADRILIGTDIEFGAEPAKPNPLTTPQREFVYDGAGKVAKLIETISLDCWFVYEPSQIWQKFAEIKQRLERGIMDFKYYRDATLVLELKTSDYVASPRYTNIVPKTTSGILANHINFSMNVIAEKGKDWGAKVLSVDRTINQSVKPFSKGGNVETRAITVTGEETPSMAIIDDFIQEMDLSQVDTIEYEKKPDQLVWSARVNLNKSSSSGGAPARDLVDFKESISVTGGGQGLNFFRRSGSRLPLQMSGKKQEFIIVVTGEVKSRSLLDLRFPQRGMAGMPGAKETGAKGKGKVVAMPPIQPSTIRKKLGQSGAIEFAVSIAENNPDGSAKTYSLRYTETYKRAVEEEEIQSIVVSDYKIRSLSDVLNGVPFGQARREGWAVSPPEGLAVWAD